MIHQYDRHTSVVVRAITAQRCLGGALAYYGIQDLHAVMLEFYNAMYSGGCCNTSYILLFTVVMIYCKTRNVLSNVVVVCIL